MKLKPQELLRWVLAPLIAVCLLAWAGMAYSDKAQADRPPAHKQLEIPKAATDENLQKVKDLLEELKAKEFENKTLELEGQRKNTDWWLSFLAIIAAIIAIGGAFIPFMMGRKNIESLELEKEKVLAVRTSAEQAIAAIEKSMTRIEQAQKEAEKTLGAIQAAETYIKGRQATIDELVIKYQSGQPDGKAEEISKAVTAVQNDPESSPALKLRAKAIEASVPEQADRAYKRWYALTELDATDVSAHFNAGYWAQELGEKSQGSKALDWLKQAEQHYSQALGLKPDMHEAANNLGNVLATEAKATATSDPDAARKLWQQAGEKYQQALNIKPDSNEAAYNWGNALAVEAEAMATSDPDAARKLWQQAGEKYQQALSIKPDSHEAAYNWGNALAAEAQAMATSDPVAARKLWQQAGEKFQQALNIKPDKHEAAYNWGNALAVEAKTMTTSDPVAARKLWQQAGEKFQQALNIKPDKQEAAYNWGNALAAEAQAMATSDPVAARKLWQQAGEKYQQILNIKPDSHEAAYNWGNALVAEAEAMATSDPDTARKLWQQAVEKFQQALNIKPDYHNAANSWGAALLYEANSLAPTDAAQARLLRDQAEQLLLQHAVAAPGELAYNLACVYGRRGDVENCLKWLKTSQDHKTLPDRDHLKRDPDLDAVRNAPEFIEWFKTACPQDK